MDDTHNLSLPQIISSFNFYKRDLHFSSIGITLPPSTFPSRRRNTRRSKKQAMAMLFHSTTRFIYGNSTQLYSVRVIKSMSINIIQTYGFIKLTRPSPLRLCSCISSLGHLPIFTRQLCRVGARILAHPRLKR